jgi:O-antigen ligase
MDRWYEDMTVSSHRRWLIGAQGLLTFTLGAFCLFSTFSIAGTQTALAAAVLIWIVLVLFRAAPPPDRTALDRAIILFLAASLTAVLFSAERLASFVNLKNLPLLVIVYLFGRVAETRRQRRLFFTVLLCSGAASSLYGIVIFALKKGSGTLNRTAGPFSNAMTYGGVLLFLCSLFLAVGICSGLRRRVRLATLGAAVLAGTALFFSFTRSAWLGMLASAVVVLSLQRRRLLILLALFIVVISVFLPGPYRYRITSMWDPDYRTNVHRLEMIRGGWEIFKDHPWVGVGTMDLSDTYRKYMPPGAVHVFGHLHNIFLQVAVTMGVVGLAAFCYLLYSFFRLVIGNLHRSFDGPERAWVVGSLGALTGFVVSGMFEWNFGDAEVVMLLYAVIGGNLALSMRADRFAGPGGSLTAG